MSIARFMKVSEAQYVETMGDRERMPLGEIPLPRRATAGSAGYDFVSPVEVTVPAGGSALIPTGIRAEMEPGWVLMLFPRSSLGFRHALRLSNTVGVIDSDYRGEIMVALHNHSNKDLWVSDHERIAQLVIVPYLNVDFVESEELDETERGAGGFGSTGK